MATLTQLLANHGCILVLDAASTNVQVGLLRTSAAPIWRAAPEEAGKALFTGADGCLREAELTMKDVTAFAFCEGPGSMLGVRTTAMAVRTWQAELPRPAFHYQSLPLIAHELARTGAALPLTVIADARRDTWHAIKVATDGYPSSLRRLATATLAESPEVLYQPTSLRAWATPPKPTQPCDYNVAALFAAHADKELFSGTLAPDAFQHEAPDYKKWSAQVHSAATK